MKHSILIIDDEQIGAENLQKHFSKSFPDTNCITAYTEDEINRSISEDFYDVAIVDLRMDDFSFNGFDIIKNIIEVNPFAKIIITTAYINEYEEDINDILKTGKISGIFSKDKFDNFVAKLDSLVNAIFSSIESETEITSQNLRDLYLEVKNEKDVTKKGMKLERFTSFLFAVMGFVDIQKRVIDKSSNEIDLIIRNEVDDVFFRKLSPYFCIECKNTISKVDKNIFIVFREKLNHTNGLSKLGFIITPSGFKRTAYLEALRSSNSDKKIIFISNNEIEYLITAGNILQALKKVIDNQTKDN